MILRPASRTDLPAIEAFLKEHIAGSMFLLSNLHDHGLFGSDPRALRLWLLGDPVAGVFGMTEEGMVLMQIPDADATVWAAAAALCSGRRLIGASGSAPQVRQFLGAVGLSDAASDHDADEPGFVLDLDRLRIPDLSEGARLVPFAAHRETALLWRRDYLVEILGQSEAEAMAMAHNDLGRFAVRDSHRVLEIDGVPVAMTGFNARIPGAVQVGGVYVPPDQRRQGYGRMVVALHLAEARAAGDRQDVLFAVSDYAARAYRAIGFEQAGPYGLVLFSTPQELAA